MSAGCVQELVFPALPFPVKPGSCSGPTPVPAFTGCVPEHPHPRHACGQLGAPARSLRAWQLPQRELGTAWGAKPAKKIRGGKGKINPWVGVGSRGPVHGRSTSPTPESRSGSRPGRQLVSSNTGPVCSRPGEKAVTLALGPLRRRLCRFLR